MADPANNGKHRNSSEQSGSDLPPPPENTAVTGHQEAPFPILKETDKSVPVNGTGSADEPVSVSGIIEDPVEILVGLAERGEIDPWNINIIEVTDRFLSELERQRQLNLQISGRTLFYAATLLRMKSEQLEQMAEPEEGIGEDDDSFGEEFDLVLDSEIDYSGRLGVIERLEHEIQRRLDRKNMRKSPITLFELITELKNIEKEERRRRRLASDPRDALLIDADDVVGIAHDEGYQASASLVLEECLLCLENKSEMTLTDICRKLGWGLPEVYIPLLFLALDGRCTLRQEEFFGDVFVQVCRAGE
jgi:segregation and condensation protein A